MNMIWQISNTWPESWQMKRWTLCPYRGRAHSQICSELTSQPRCSARVQTLASHLEGCTELEEPGRCTDSIVCGGLVALVWCEDSEVFDSLQRFPWPWLQPLSTNDAVCCACLCFTVSSSMLSFCVFRTSRDKLSKAPTLLAFSVLWLHFKFDPWMSVNLTHNLYWKMKWSSLSALLQPFVADWAQNTN